MPEPEEWNPASMGDWPHTPPFEVMRDLLAKDPNLFWKLDIGHIQNTLEAAMDRLETVEKQWSTAVTLWNRSVDSKMRLRDRLDAVEALRERVANLIPLDLIHDKGRPGQPQDAFEAADRIIVALAAAPTHVPPPRTAFLEQCEVEIYEGLTYVRLDDVMHLLSDGTPSEEQIEKAARAFFREYHGEDIWPELRDDGELDTRSRALAATRAALAAAGVASQEPIRLPDFFAPKPMPNSYVPAPVLPSSGVDEVALSEVIARVTDLWDDPLDEVHDIPQIARAVAEWLKGQGGEGRESTDAN